MLKGAFNAAIYHSVVAIRALIRRPAIRSLLYDAWNRTMFSGMWIHEQMIADKARVDAYQRAISDHIEKGDIVVDLGTGTGILAMLAARRGAARVFAIDHGEMIETARRLAAANGIGQIEFLRMHSSKFTPPENVDVVLHEQIGSHLFDEHMIANLTDLRDRILRPGGRILPSRFALFLEPISLHEEYRVPSLHQNTDVHGLDFSCLAPAGGGTDAITFDASVQRVVLNREVSHLLATPEPIMTVDLETIDPSHLPKALEFRKEVTAAGELDGFCLYFDVLFDADNVLSTSPLGRSTSWKITMIRVPVERLTIGDVLHCRLEIGAVTNIATWRLHYAVERAGRVVELPQRGDQDGSRKAS